MNADITAPSSRSPLRFRQGIFIPISVLSVILLIVIRYVITQAVGDTTGNFSARLSIDVIYQAVTALLAIAILLLVRIVHPENFKMFLHVGDSSAHPQPVSLLGISAKDSWKQTGIQFAIVVTIATSIFLYFTVMNRTLPIDRMIAVLPLALVFAMINAFVEETLTRFAIVVPLYDALPRSMIYVIAALVFGVPHFFGTPGGVIGSAMAGFLGWLLAKSMVETRGVWWAWFIHFLQDVVIFVALFSML